MVVSLFFFFLSKKGDGLGITKGEEKMKEIILSGAELHQLIKVELEK